MIFGKLTLISLSILNHRTFALCQCECGQQKKIRYIDLKLGKSRSCGCSRIKHGGRRSPEYTVWRGMKARCENKNHVHFSNYGGRGISVCERWKEFKNFLEDMGPRPAGFEIDRKKNDLPYSPENCRWVDKKTQNGNRRRWRKSRSLLLSP